MSSEAMCAGQLDVSRIDLTYSTPKTLKSPTSLHMNCAFVGSKKRSSSNECENT